MYYFQGSREHRPPWGPHSLGFTVHPEKSGGGGGFNTKIVFVGFIINSVSMTIRLTPEKAEDIVKMFDHS